MYLVGTSQGLFSAVFQRDETQSRDDENDEQQEGRVMKCCVCVCVCVFYNQHVLFCWFK
jgi:hypothetical protein